MRISRSEGNYNFIAPHEKQVRHVLELPEGAPRKAISIVIDIDSNLDNPYSNPIDLTESIKEHYTNHILYATDKEDILKACQWVFDNEDLVLIEWHQDCLKALKSMLEDIQSRIKAHEKGMRLCKEALDEKLQGGDKYEKD